MQRSQSSDSVANALANDNVAQTKILTGTMTTYTGIGGSGKNVVFSSCSTCPTILWTEVGLYPGMLILKPGTLDEFDAKAACQPVAEIFTANRVGWCGQRNGAAQS